MLGAPAYAALVLTATALVTVPAHAEAQAAAPTCHGQRATIVGQPKGKIRGTDRRDVIVTNGAVRVDGRGGNDLICVTGGAAGRLPAQVIDGAGDDTIDTRGTTYLVASTLGAGDDRYEGGRGFDFVSAERDTGTDHISTGGGTDIVISGNGSITGRAGSGPATRNVVDLGSGADFYEAIGQDRSTVRGGPGRDGLFFATLRGAPGTRFAYDLQRQTERRNGRRYLRWHDIENFTFALAGRSASIVGTGGSDHVQISDSRLQQPLSLHLLGGDDRVSLDASSPHQLDLDAGTGRDEVSLSNFRDRLGHAAEIDLAHGTLRVAGKTSPLLGVEKVNVLGFDRVDFVGGNQDDVFRALGDCRVSAYGGLGDDRLAVLSDPLGGLDGEQAQDCPGATLRGGPGDDHLVGSQGDDTLLGDAGTDVADGHAGTDHCVAETRRHCEG